MESTQGIPMVFTKPDGANKKIIFNNLDEYKDAITQFKNEMIALVNGKVISEQTATRIILETEYSFFQQIIEIHYTQKDEMNESK